MPGFSSTYRANLLRFPYYLLQNFVYLSTLSVMGLGVVIGYGNLNQAPTRTVNAFVSIETQSGAVANNMTGAVQVIAGATARGDIYTTSGSFIQGRIASPNCVITSTGAVQKCAYQGAPIQAQYIAGGGGGTTYTAGQGLTLNGTSFKVNASLTGSTIAFSTVSGALLTLNAPTNAANYILGNLGVGRKTSRTALEVQGTESSALLTINSAATSTSYIMGNVSIGKSTAAATKLDINGALTTSSNITDGGLATTTGPVFVSGSRTLQSATYNAFEKASLAAAVVAGDIGIDNAGNDWIWMYKGDATTAAGGITIADILNQVPILYPGVNGCSACGPGDIAFGDGGGGLTAASALLYYNQASAILITQGTMYVDAANGQTADLYQAQVAGGALRWAVSASGWMVVNRNTNPATPKAAVDVVGTMSGYQLIINKGVTGSGHITIHGSAGSYTCYWDGSGNKWYMTYVKSGVFTTTQAGASMCP